MEQYSKKLFTQRIKIFNDLLHKPEGTTYEEYADECLKIDDQIDLATLRKDKSRVNKILKEHKYCPIIKSGKNGKMRMRLEDNSINICSLISNRRPSIFHKDLIDMLSHSSGMLPEEWLEKLNVPSKEKEAKNDIMGQKIIMQFDDRISSEDCFKYLPDIFKAIRKKQVISFEFCPFKDNPRTVILHPEFLKQYNRLWYVYGMSKIQHSNELKLEKYPLDRIKSEINIIKGNFISSNTNYDEYFNSCIGVDVHRKTETLIFLVKESYIKRFEEHNIFYNIYNHNLQNYNVPKNYECYRTEIVINKELTRYLGYLGNDIIVVEPKSLRNNIVKEMQKCLDNYKTLEQNTP